MRNKYIRYIQKKIDTLLTQILFKTSHISTGGKIGLFGISICFISLFMSWVSSIGSIISSGAADIEKLSSFSSLLGGVGYFILISLLIELFFIFSIQKKEKIKYLSSYHISDFIALIVGSIFILLLCIHTFILISGLKIFSGNITHSGGIILCISGTIITLIGSIAISSDYRKNIKGSYVSNSSGDTQEALGIDKKDNMKLPF